MSFQLSQDIVDHLPFWLNGEEATKLAKTCQVLYERWINAMIQTLQDSSNTEKMIKPFLTLKAWERLLTQQDGETDALFRQRIINAYDILANSGTNKGLQDLLTFYNAPSYEIKERTKTDPWDTITIDADTSTMNETDSFFQTLLNDTGRACRTYRFEGFKSFTLFEGVSDKATQFDFTTISF